MKNKKLISAIAAAVGMLAIAAPAFAHDMGEPEDGMMNGTTSTSSHQETDKGHVGPWNEGDAMKFMHGRPAVVGTVASVSGNTITVSVKMMPRPEHMASGTPATTTVWTVDASSATVIKNGATSTVSAISVGDMLMVNGTASGTSVAAKTIIDGFMKKPLPPKPENPEMLFQGNGEPIVAGTVSSVSSSSITITNKSNVTYTVDVSNAKIIKGNATSTVASIVSGDAVLVQGTINGTSVTASGVIDQAAHPQPKDNPGKGLGERVRGFFGGIGNFFSHLFGF